MMDELYMSALAPFTHSGFSNRAHIVRAMLEAICFQTREVLEAMRKDADLAGLKLLRVDGGAARNDMLMQMQVWIGQVWIGRPTVYVGGLAVIHTVSKYRDCNL